MDHDPTEGVCSGSTVIQHAAVAIPVRPTCQQTQRQEGVMVAEHGLKTGRYGDHYHHRPISHFIIIIIIIIIIIEFV